MQYYPQSSRKNFPGVSQSKVHQKVKYSGDTKTGHVWFLNWFKVVNFEMVRFLNAILKTDVDNLKSGQKWYGFQMPFKIQKLTFIRPFKIQTLNCPVFECPVVGSSLWLNNYFKSRKYPVIDASKILIIQKVFNLD